MSKIFIPIVIINGIIEESEAFEDADAASDAAYKLAQKYAGRWFRDDYLKDWMAVVTYQHTLDNQEVEVLIATTNFIGSKRDSVCCIATRFLSDLFKGGRK